MKTTLKTVILWLAVLTAVLVPCLKLFQEGDWLFYVIRDSAMHKEWLEIGILAVLLIVACLCIRNRKILFGTLTGIILLVAYLHSMLLPLLLAGLWFAVLMLTGNIVAGIAVAIVTAGILSVFGQCTPNSVLLVTLAIQLILRFVFRSIGTFPLGRKQSIGTFPLGRKQSIGTFPLDRKRPIGTFPLGRNRTIGTLLQRAGNISNGRKDRLLLALIVLVLLVQIGRANECIDFDSLWYGVRSLQVLTPGGSIFEDLGLVGMVYTYPKGFEILTLPLNMTESYAVISAFNLFLFVYGLSVTADIAERLTSFYAKNGKETGDAAFGQQVSPYAKLAVLFTVLVPGIVNMTLSAKPDLITWLLQLVMLDRFFAVIAETKRREKTVTGKAVILKALPVISVYLLSLAMKPTALIFSTALLGMMFVWTVYRAVIGRRFGQEGRSLLDENSQQGRFLLDENSQQGHSFGQQGTSLLTENYIEIIFSASALAIVWGRTMKLTGMPFTSVFTGVLEKLGFTMKYPFGSRALPQSWQEGSQLVVALKRVVKMLLMPDGKDMSHVIIAWGGSLFFVLGVLIVRNVAVIVKNRRKEKSDPAAKGIHSGEKSGASLLLPAALTVFLPFIVTCFVTLTMLYQVDGNYYMTMYSIVIFLAVVFEQEGRSLLTENEQQGHSFVQEGTSLSSDFVQEGTSPLTEKRLTAAAFALILVFQFVIMTMTNWAGVTGFTKIQANRGYFSHKEYYREQLTEVDGSLYDFLSADPRTRVVAFGEHPTCLQFDCITQSYNDITSPWGNVEIVNTADAFIDYLHFARVDYVYGDAAHLSEDAWKWSKGLIDEMTVRGVLTDFIYEGENWVAKVN